MLKVANISKVNGAHLHEEACTKDAAKTGSKALQKTTAVEDKDAKDLAALAPVETEEQKEKAYIALYISQGYSETTARALYRFLD